MPFDPEIEALLSGPGQPVPEREASYGQQLARGFGSAFTLGMWEPFKEAGVGGPTETLGRIAGIGTSFIPVARGAGLTLAGLSKLPGLSRLLAPGVEAGTAAANMLKTGRQIGRTFSPLGSALAVGGAVPIQSEAEAAIQRMKGETPRPLSERMMTGVLGAGLGALAGRSMARGRFRIPADKAFDRDATVVLLERQIGELSSRIKTSSPEDAAKLVGPLEDLKTRLAAILEFRKTAPAGLGGEIPEVPYKNLDEYYGLKKPIPGGTVLPELTPPGTVYPQGGYAEWLKSGGTAAGAMRGIRPSTFGEIIEKTLPAEQALGGEYSPSFAPNIREALLGRPVDLHEWQLQRINDLKRQVGPAADPIRIGVGQQLRKSGTPMANDLDAMTTFIDGSTFPPDTMHLPMKPAKPISGGAVTSYPLSSDIGGLRSGFAPTVSMAMRHARETLGNWTQIAPPRWVVSGIPGLENLPDIMAITKLKERSTFGTVTKELDSILKLPPDVKDTIKRLFGEYQNAAPEAFYQAVREKVPGAAEEVNKLRDILDRMWEYYVATGVLDPKQRILNYFPHVRDVREIRLPGVLELERGTGTLPITIENMLKSFSPQFAKTRSITDPELIPTMKSFDDVLRIYVHQFSRFSALHEMTPDINQALVATPEILKKYIATYMNYALGRTQPDISQANQIIRNLNFMRAIGFNALSPVKNLMQMINTFSVTSNKAFFQAFNDMKDPGRLALLDQAGVGALVRGRRSWSEIMEWNPENLQGLGKTMMNKALETSGTWFSKSEEINQLHAVLAGLRQAEYKGITDPQAAMKFALTLLNHTQFQVGDQLANLSPAFRSGAGRIIGQFQTFRLNQMHFMARLLDSAMDGARKGASGDIRGMVDGMLPFIKFWGSSIAIGGPLAVLPGDWSEDYVTRAMFGKAMHIPGLMELLFGVTIPGGIGIGTIDADDMNSFLSFVPGPSVGYIQALIGTATGVSVGQGIDLSRAGDPLTQEARMRLAVSMLPGGVQTNRVLQALRLIQNDGEYQRAMDLNEFIGGAKPSGALIADRASSLQEVLLGAAGYQPTWRMQATKQALKEEELLTDYRSTIRRGSQAIASGDQEEVQGLLDKFNKRYEEYLPAPVAAIPRSSIRRALIEQNLPPTLRRHLPLPIRGAEELLRPPTWGESR